jgi:hypothetical protein
MQFRGLMAVLLFIGLVAAGCGWSPPSAPPPKPDTCSPSDGPSDATIQSAIANLTPPGGTAWRETGRGHTTNCRLYWVQVTSAEDPAAPQQLLFFDRNTPLGTVTPQPRPYITVIGSGEDTVTVQFQWRVGNDPPCCPTGIAQVRFQLGSDGKLKALDPLPNP